jgi:HemY protein
MGRVFRILLLAILVVVAGLILAAVPGRVAAQIGTFSVDLSTPFAVVLLLVLGFLTHLLFGAVHLPGRIAHGFGRRSRRQGDLATTRALVALAASDPAAARREAGRARRLLGDTPQTLLLSAEAARLAGRESEAAEALAALAGDEQASFLGLRGQLRQAIAKSDWKSAGALAAKADAVYPGAAWLREERARLAIRAGDWTGALLLTGDDRAKAALGTAAAEAETDPAQGLTLARQAWEADASLAPAALAYARRLRAAGEDRRAERVLADSWAVRPHPDLAAFVLASATQPQDALPAARRLAVANPDHPETHLLLARAALAGGAVAEARREAETAQGAGLNQRRLFLLRAEIEEMEGHAEAASAALRQAAGAEPDPVWRCTHCHMPSASWQAACPVCLTPGGLAWGNQAQDKAIPGRAGIGGAVRRLLRSG